MTVADPAESVRAWTDPLYRPLTRLPNRGAVQRFAGVSAEVTVVDTDPDCVQAQWMPDRAIVLAVDDRTSPEDLAAALPAFRAYARALTDRPASAMLTLPSRDVDRCRVAREGGFAARSVVAVRRLPRVAEPVRVPAGVIVRDARPEDADDMLGLWWALAEYEVRLGTLRFTPRIGAAIAAGLPDVLAGPGPVLVAEVEGRVRGILIAGPVPAGVADRFDAHPAGYIDVASTAADARGRGIGGVLVAEMHRRFVGAGLVAAALDYSAVSPLSIPFWSQQGYRPLLTGFVSPL